MEMLHVEIGNVKINTKMNDKLIFKYLSLIDTETTCIPKKVHPL